MTPGVRGGRGVGPMLGGGIRRFGRCGGRPAPTYSTAEVDVSVSLTTFEGCLAVEMPGRRGKVWLYRVEVLTDTPERFSVRLWKVEDPDGTAYLVQIGRRWVECDCKDHQCRRRFAGGECKHVTACRELRELLAAMAGVR